VLRPGAIGQIKEAELAPKLNRVRRSAAVHGGQVVEPRTGRVGHGSELVNFAAERASHREKQWHPAVRAAISTLSVGGSVCETAL
jgi:hypothetical protein